ncbi:MAG: hypothetical protein PVG35_04690 [Desulfobacterales bacterium]|jgi:hypothetical protein
MSKKWLLMARIQYSAVIGMDLSLQSSKKKNTSSLTKWIGRALIFSFFVLHSSCHSPPNAITESSLSETSNAGMAWIVYFESGTTCYDDIKYHAGHIWPVRGPIE